MSKNQELEALFETIADIYLKNMKYFQRNHNKVYNKIQEFEKLNIENFFLEFENNHFEIIDKEENKTYNCDPFFDAQKRCANIEDKLKLCLIKKSFILDCVYYKNSINAYQFINEYIQEKEKKDFEFNKFIFLGTLLGIHLNDLDKHLNSKAYLIIEDNLEIFRLSLFLTDYEELARNSKLFFCIKENTFYTKNIIKQFLEYKYYHNNHIGVELSTKRVIPYIDILTKELIDYDPYNYSFSEYLISLKRALYYQKISSYGLLKLDKKQNIWDSPILFLGAGPSFGKSYEWVYMNQDKFIIVCAAACLKRLELLHIIPDIILSVDGQQKQILSQFEVKKTLYQNSLLISSIKTDKEVIDKQNLDNTFFIQDNLKVFEKHMIFTGLTVGDIGLSLLLNLGTTDIYLLGFDAAISDTGKTHDGAHKNIKIELKEANIKENHNFDTKKDLIKVKGNFQDEVYTLMLYSQMIASINNLTSKLDKKIKIYNLSNGAFFRNTIPLKKENLITHTANINKKELHNKIKQNLKSISSKDLSKKDFANFKQEKKILNKLFTIKEDNLDKDFQKYKNQYKNSLSLQILEQFFKLISPYVNTQEKHKIRYKQFRKVIEELKNSFLF